MASSSIQPQSTMMEHYGKDADLGKDVVVETHETTADDTTRPPSDVQPRQESQEEEQDAVQRSGGWLKYIRTKHFFVTLLLGQILALCLTATNTFSGFLANQGISIPAFQSLFNYVILAAIYMTYTIYKKGWKEYGVFLKQWGWKFVILSFCDVEGNYFTVLAYRYGTILNITLINFWAIVLVVAISFTFLKVRYHISQIFGILICIGGLGIMLGSDHITGLNQYTGTDELKGDLFALVGATFYGMSNVAEEYLVSKRPMYEVLGQMGLYGIIINGVQAAIFDRDSFQSAMWIPAAGGWMVGYTLALAIFYSLAPIVFRMGSAAFFNISLLTVNFWSLIVGIEALGIPVPKLYPVAFVCIIIGQVIYFLGKPVFGDGWKAWLGRNQEAGDDGLGTAKRLKNKQRALV